MPDRVFLSYASDDLETVRRVYDGLVERGVTVWFDQEDLGTGQWKRQITRAIQRSRYFIICISEAALRKTGNEPGFQDVELNYAHDIAQAQDPQSFQIIPIRLEDCDRGDHRLSVWQQFDLFEDWDGTLNRLAVQIGGTALEVSRPEPPPSAEEVLREGLQGKMRAFYFAGNFDQAIVMIDALLSINKTDAEAWYNKGVVQGKLGRTDEALMAYERATDINPEDAEAWSNKGVVLGELGRTDEELKAYGRAIDIKPDYAEAWSNKGVVLGELGRTDEALAAFERATDINPEYAQAWYNKGVVLKQLGRTDEKLKAYDRATDINPDDAEAWSNKGVALGQLGRTDEALMAFDRATDINPRYAKAWYNKGITLKILGREEEAEAAFKKARDLGFDPAS